jgi:hypothetical protein
MTWEIRRLDTAHSDLFADDTLVVMTGDENIHRLWRLRDRLAARETADVSITVTFRPGDVLGLTDVALDDEDRLSDEQYLGLIEEAMHRLEVFLADWRDAQAREMQPSLQLT